MEYAGCIPTHFGPPMSERAYRPQVTGLCSYSPSYLPVWGNENAFSWEPFLERWLAPGEEYAWTIEYVFGLASAVAKL